VLIGKILPEENPRNGKTVDENPYQYLGNTSSAVLGWDVGLPIWQCWSRGVGRGPMRKVMGKRCTIPWKFRWYSKDSTEGACPEKQLLAIAGLLKPTRGKKRI